MRLYHGTDVVIDVPRIVAPNRALDFGPGFYTTSDRDQACRWARIVTRRHRTGTSLLHIYDFDESVVRALRYRRFDEPSREWLDFVAAHRLSQYDGPSYDLVIGPVANDRTLPVIQQYLQAPDRELFAPVALALIRPQALADQFVFQSAAALAALTLVEVCDAR